jgi:hypothetical protein
MRLRCRFSETRSLAIYAGPPFCSRLMQLREWRVAGRFFALATESPHIVCQFSETNKLFNNEVLGPVAQLVEHRTFNAVVAGSIPARLTIYQCDEQLTPVCRDA